MKQIAALHERAFRAAGESDDWLKRLLHLSCITVNSCKLLKESWHLSYVRCMTSAKYVDADVLEAIDVDMSTAFEDAFFDVMSLQCVDSLLDGLRRMANEPARVFVHHSCGEFMGNVQARRIVRFRRGQCDACIFRRRVCTIRVLTVSHLRQ